MKNVEDFTQIAINNVTQDGLKKCVEHARKIQDYTNLREALLLNTCLSHFELN